MQIVRRLLLNIQVLRKKFCIVLTCKQYILMYIDGIFIFGLNLLVAFKITLYYYTTKVLYYFASCHLEICPCKHLISFIRLLAMITHILDHSTCV